MIVVAEEAAEAARETNREQHKALKDRMYVEYSSSIDTSGIKAHSLDWNKLQTHRFRLGESCVVVGDLFIALAFSLETDIGALFLEFPRVQANLIPL